MRSDPARRCAAVALLTLTLAACGQTLDPAPDSAAPAPVDIGLRPYAPQAASSPTILPPVLVGTWSGTDPQGLGSWTLVFAEDGSYRETNLRRGVVIGGQAAVAGRRLYLQPDRAESQTLTWAVSDRTLSLDGTVYQRTDPVGR